MCHFADDLTPYSWNWPETWLTWVPPSLGVLAMFGSLLILLVLTKSACQWFRFILGNAIASGQPVTLLTHILQVTSKYGGENYNLHRFRLASLTGLVMFSTKRRRLRSKCTVHISEFSFLISVGFFRECSFGNLSLMPLAFSAFSEAADAPRCLLVPMIRGGSRGL